MAVQTLPWGPPRRLRDQGGRLDWDGGGSEEWIRTILSDRHQACRWWDWGLLLWWWAKIVLGKFPHGIRVRDEKWSILGLLEQNFIQHSTFERKCNYSSCIF